jgi:hypothetical protein
MPGMKSDSEFVAELLERQARDCRDWHDRVEREYRIGVDGECHVRHGGGMWIPIRWPGEGPEWRRKGGVDG